MIIAFSAGLLAANAGVAGAVVGGQVVYPSEYPISSRSFLRSRMVPSINAGEP